MNYLRVTDLLARHCNLPMVDVPNIAYYDCHDLPDWSISYDNDKTVQLMCGVTFMDGCSIERVCCSMDDLKRFVKDVNFYARNCAKFLDDSIAEHRAVNSAERQKKAEQVLQKLIKQAEDKKNA